MSPPGVAVILPAGGVLYRVEAISYLNTNLPAQHCSFDNQELGLSNKEDHG